ncbi:putative aliphatic sulfonates-binding protein [Echria macrotheca]|uniref:Aliphatic sulfonates-binding protein n=1 Tax=Echria macrotheca TaxID=438768 RepID=A0AAJ0F7C4_9PEZI|nr:putative aliphatic sulfonates-binding protein [Echria macrotheca]
MNLRSFCGLVLALLYLDTAASIKVAFSPMWIEGTPFVYANKNVYKADTATSVSGGVASLGSAELGGNAETQGLIQYVNHKNYRLIYVVVEVTYRLVANKAAGIKTLADLKGKRIGTFQGSSAEVFVRMLLGSAGLANSDYTIVSGNVCMRAPCGANTFPSQLKAKQIDAFGVWETAVELGVEALGEENAVIFKNASIYREVYSLFATQQSLQDATTRKKIVAYVKALNETLDVFRNDPEKVYPMVSQAIGVDVPVLRKVWPDHVWGPGSLGTDLVDYLYREDQYLSKANKRTAATRDELEKFIDRSVYEDAMKL